MGLTVALGERRQGPCAGGGLGARLWLQSTGGRRRKSGAVALRRLARPDRPASLLQASLQQTDAAFVTCRLNLKLNCHETHPSGCSPFSFSNATPAGPRAGEVDKCGATRGRAGGTAARLRGRAARSSRRVRPPTSPLDLSSQGAAAAAPWDWRDRRPPWGGGAPHRAG